MTSCILLAFGLGLAAATVSCSVQSSVVEPSQISDQKTAGWQTTLKEAVEVEEVVGATVVEVEAEDVEEVRCVPSCLASIAQSNCYVGQLFCLEHLGIVMFSA